MELIIEFESMTSSLQGCALPTELYQHRNAGLSRLSNSYHNAKKVKNNNPNFRGYYKQDVLDRFSFVFVISNFL